MKAALFTVVVAGSASSQDLLVCVERTGSFTAQVTAEFVGQIPAPLVQAWADVSVVMTSVNPITITNYNPSYDTSLGDAQITGNGTTSVSFVGSANAFFGTPDASNPLFVLDFEWTPDRAFTFELVGQNSAIFDEAPFGLVELYQDALGNPGTLTYRIDNKLFPPAPGTAITLVAGCAFAARRRRK